MPHLSRAAIIAGHPGHELRLYAWMAATRPLVLILTDGSGGGSTSRLSYSRKLIEECGGRAGRLFGQHTDREIYSWLLEGRTAEFDTLGARLASDLANAGVESIICDGFEGYNPVHDVAHAIAFTAGRQLGVPVWEHLLASPAECRPNDLSIDLSDALFDRKMAAAARYLPLRYEIEQAVAREGGAGLRRETLRAVTRVDLSRFDLEPPYYETYGAAQVAAGRYRDVICYGAHVRPLLKRLVAAQLASR